MKLTERIDALVDLTSKDDLREEQKSGFKKGDMLEHKTLGAKAYFVKDLPSGKIRVTRATDGKEYDVPLKEWISDGHQKKKVK